MASDAQYTSASEEFWSGVRDEIPLMLGVIPFGMVFGVLGVEVGLDPVTIMAMSIIIFGGASQVVFAQMVSAGAAGMVIAGTVGIINLRHALYSATFTTYISSLPMRWRVVISYLLTDEGFFVSLVRFQTKPYSPNMYFHMVGTGLVLWVCWQAATLAGIVVGELIPPSLNLGFAIPLTFMAITVPQITSIPPLVAVITGGVVAILGQSLPWNIWVIAAALAGMTAGYLAEIVLRRNKATS
ncbi:MAG: AzlC family ABC transporter permease [Alphaproteobacteria bacterium]|nr:AzlC family ABC transporter permease [Alphaproteobacteria bacterium]